MRRAKEIWHVCANVPFFFVLFCFCDCYFQSGTTANKQTSWCDVAEQKRTWQRDTVLTQLFFFLFFLKRPCYVRSGAFVPRLEFFFPLFEGCNVEGEAKVNHFPVRQSHGESVRGRVKRVCASSWCCCLYSKNELSERENKSY